MNNILLFKKRINIICHTTKQLLKGWFMQSVYGLVSFDYYINYIESREMYTIKQGKDAHIRK